MDYYNGAMGKPLPAAGAELHRPAAVAIGVVRIVIAPHSPPLVVPVTPPIPSHALCPDVSFNARVTGKFPPAIETPNIDALAARGQVLTRSYTHSICGPSRTALLTSKLSFNLGNPFPVNSGGHGGLGPEHNTIADELKARNYSTHFVGKWGVDDGVEGTCGLTCGRYRGLPPRGVCTLVLSHLACGLRMWVQCGHDLDWRVADCRGAARAPPLAQLS